VQNILFFLKYPKAGKVKTRLGKDLGYKEAADIYSSFIADTLFKISVCKAAITVCADPYSSDIEGYRKLLGDDFKIIFQRGENIGEKMFNAFADVFNSGFRDAVLIGSDIPTLDAETIELAFEALGEGKPCLGPADDGGYYLIGLKSSQLDYQIFSDIEWSTESVLESTVSQMKKLKLSPVILPEKSDIDDIEDLKNLMTRHNFSKLCPNTAAYLKKKS
jgi:hypothetical protein